MKTRLIMIRHGFSRSNKELFFTGQYNVELTDIGHRQAECCGEWLRDKGIDVLYASDLQRTMDTAMPVSAATGLPIIQEPGLREIDAGKWEGLPFDDLKRLYPAEFDVWRHDIGNSVCPGGESVQAFSDRILTTVERLARENEGKTLCLVTHATPIRAVCTAASGRNISEMQQIPWVRNASINIFEYEDGRFTAVETDIAEHLGQYCVASTDKV